MFWDNVEISVVAGRGGNGLVSFRRELGEAKGGPDGGDGGDGGTVLLVADPDANTLVAYARRKRFEAPSGKPGGKTRRHGKSADDLILKVPVGTIIYRDTQPLADLTEPGQTLLVAKGGTGGFGNAHFKSSRRQTPRQAEFGEPGETVDLKLELKLVADIGLVGIPSVGKSTFLAHVTAAKPKIADYPFTTTVPQLGIATVGQQGYVLADIPGLIEGAHQGKGLGDAFLRHIERTKVIIHLLDVTRDDAVADYEQINKELKSFNKALLKKPTLIALNKVDTLDAAARKKAKADIERRLGSAVHLVSAVAGDGLQALLREAAGLTKAYREPTKPEPVPTFTLADLAPQSVSVTKSGKGFELKGARLERLAKQTDFQNPEATRRFWWVAGRLGVDKQLEKLGASSGVELTIAGIVLTWPGTE